MSLPSGTRLGPYQVVDRVGAGGMGEVYKATDTRLGRTVAVKVLPAHVAADPALRARLEREAKAISSLNHPHICTLYDIGHQDGTDFLVMEYLEGETLAQRLEQGPLRIAQALQTGIEIADALDKAHRQGIVHRDLKPGNVMLTKRGAKLLDFGLAKLHPAVGGAGLSAAATVTSPLTGAGSIVGTYQYMSPEQLEGREADERSDIFAFGALLYEMISGTRAFTGTTQASVIASILKDTPPQLSSHQPLSPPILDGIVATCLAKSPEDRWQAAGDIGRQLKLIQTSTASGVSLRSSIDTAVVSPPPSGKSRRRAVLSVAAAILLIAVGTAAALLWLRVPVAPQPVRFAVVAPGVLNQNSLAVSPDGRYIAFVAGGSLLVRPIDSVNAQPIAGTEGAQAPFWSPDSKHIGFAAQGQLKRIALAGGPPQNIAAAVGFGGGTWNAAGDILFSSGLGSAIKRVAASGGELVDVTKLASLGHMRPSFLPDGRRFLFVNVRETAPGAQDLYIGSLDGGDPALVLSGALRAAYVPPGYLVFNRGAMVMAQSFDPDRRVLTGDPVRVVDAVAMGPSGFLAGFSASASGVLAYAPGTPTGEGLSRLTWYSRDGRSMGNVGGPANYGDVAIAPDGKRIAVHLHEASPGGNLWLWDSSRSNFSQFTFDRSHNIVPIWSPDGTSIVFASDRGGSIFNLYRKAASGATPEELLLESKISKIPEAWTAHHGGLVLFASGGPAVSDWTIWRLPLSGERTATQISPGMSEFLSEFSPDGRWVAYVATQAGGLSTFQVYVRSYPGLNGPWRISTNGGNHPRWSADGRELYYLNPQGTEIMAAAITTDGTSLAAATPRAIIKTRVRQDHYPGGVPYDVTRDGRFLVNEFVAPEPSSGGVSDGSSFTVVLNFTSGL